jgi:2-succinyl-5-enolpyruvyl-6-hydroxy-3-cyclohexene-1-carboxylate synthase
VSLTVLVVNNDGGGIFSFLPIAEVGSPAFEPFIATPHGVDLSHAAALYGARFHRPTQPAELEQALAAGLEGGLHVIEVRLERTANVEVHRGLNRRVADALEGVAKP